MCVHTCACARVCREEGTQGWLRWCTPGCAAGLQRQAGMAVPPRGCRWGPWDSGQAHAACVGTHSPAPITPARARTRSSLPTLVQPNQAPPSPPPPLGPARPQPPARARPSAPQPSQLGWRLRVGTDLGEPPRYFAVSRRCQLPPRVPTASPPSPRCPPAAPDTLGPAGMAGLPRRPAAGSIVQPGPAIACISPGSHFAACRQSCRFGRGFFLLFFFFEYRVTDGESSFPRETNLPECKRMSIISSHVIALAHDVPTIWHWQQSWYPLCWVEMPLSPPFG